MRQRIRSERGITLIELLVSVVLLGLVATPILGCIHFVRLNFVEARTQSQVQVLMRDRIANAMSAGLLTGLLTAVFPNSTSQLPGGTRVVFSTSTSAVAGYNKLYKISVTASWNADYANGRADTATLETYVISQ